MKQWKSRKSRSFCTFSVERKKSVSVHRVLMMTFEVYESTDIQFLKAFLSDGSILHQSNNNMEQMLAIWDNLVA